jgi:hypothetical protein
MRGAQGVWEMHIALHFWKGMHEGVEAVRVYYLYKHKFESFSSIFSPLSYVYYLCT